ncbi:hypothetical protein CSA80_01865 [Candidatus Saccharibacteria bacterium]|nr:MAG: hypothetical protein CSA80_01865 [Candidatus Saccharibacteria bacterium]
MIKLVVWDWNGTLFDDTHAVLRAANSSEIPMLGLPHVTLEQMRSAHDVPIIKTYQNLGVDPDFFRAKSAEISPVFHKAYEPLAAKARTRRGSRATLQKLNDQNTKCIILSNHTMEGIYFQLSRLRLVRYFADVLANDSTNTSHHTGKQHRLETYLEENNHRPEEVIIVGDTTEEIRIGRALGLHTSAISGGICSRDRLAAAKPDHLVSSVEKVLSIVKESA